MQTINKILIILTVYTNDVQFSKYTYWKYALSYSD